MYLPKWNSFIIFRNRDYILKSTHINNSRCFSCKCNHDFKLCLSSLRNALGKFLIESLGSWLFICNSNFTTSVVQCSFVWHHNQNSSTFQGSFDFLVNQLSSSINVSYISLACLLVWNENSKHLQTMKIAIMRLGVVTIGLLTFIGLVILLD